jgi:AcrR family transcriptional regulator
MAAAASPATSPTTSPALSMPAPVAPVWPVPPLDGSPPLGRRERKKRTMRRSILEAATELFADQGLSPTTVDQIAERADVSQTTFFNYFPTKTALVDALIADLVTLFDGIVAGAQGADDPVARALDVLFRASADLSEAQHRGLRDLIASTVHSSSDDARCSLGRMRGVLVRCLVSGQATGVVRSDLAADLLADAVLGLYVGVFLFWAHDAGYPVADRLREVSGLAQGLVEPRKAAELV